MVKADKVTIRLTAEQAEELDSLVDSGKFKNRSRAIRAAIDNMIVPEPVGIGDIHLKLPDTMVAEIDLLVSNEHFPSMELGIREMVRNHLEKIDVRSVMDRKNLRDEMVAEKKASTDIFDDVFSDYVQQ
ncbi:MAG: ribbon-helix-helix domain-containing protein [Candidatus Thermoplasmatota archaeon]|nr:ribbon-helix-helix domain-containing protein [Candidatus Thermoplasmatota archaeon]